MSASLAASSPAPQPRSLRLPSTDDADADDARVAALLDRLAPELAADAARNDADGRFPHENFARLHRAGLIARAVPREHGGAGATLAQASRIVAAVASADPATALVLTMTYLQHRALGRAENRWPAQVRRAVFDSAVTEGALINALRVGPRSVRRRAVACRNHCTARRRRLAIVRPQAVQQLIPRCAGWPCGRAPTSRCRESACFRAARPRRGRRSHPHDRKLESPRLRASGQP